MKKGFTLIELIVVIFIIGLLSTMAVFSLGKAREQAREEQEKNLPFEQAETRCNEVHQYCREQCALNTSEPLIECLLRCEIKDVSCK